jgi:nitroreductase
MDFLDVVRRRRMVRSFTDEPVAPESLARIMDVARRGPTAGYSQGVEFVVVTDSETRATLSRGGERTLNASGLPNFPAQAQAQIIICTSADIYKNRYREADKMRVRADVSDEDLWNVPYWHTDAGCAMMLILLAAVNEGLAAAFVGYGKAEARVRRFLGIPDDLVVIGAVLLGHEAADARQYGDVSAVKRPRRPLAEVVHRERW